MQQESPKNSLTRKNSSWNTVNLLEGLSTINLIRFNILVINQWRILKGSKLDPKSWWSKLNAAMECSHVINFPQSISYLLLWNSKP